MNLKDEIKTALITLTAAFTLSGCSGDKKNKYQTEDMLTAKYNDAIDLYNNPVRLYKKACITVYKDKEMTEKSCDQLLWVLDNNKEVTKKRIGEKTHGEEYVMPNGDGGFVEVYDDGVLKENNSIILIDKTFQIIGEGKNYEYNLNRWAGELQAEQNRQAKICRLEQIRAQKRAEARRRANMQNAVAEIADSVEVKDVSENADSTVAVSANYEIIHKHHTDSILADSVKQAAHLKRMKAFEHE